MNSITLRSSRRDKVPPIGGIALLLLCVRLRMAGQGTALAWPGASTIGSAPAWS